MISWAFIILSAVTVIGFVVMFGALRHAVDGYEDSDGFHQGVPQWNTAPLALAVRIGEVREIATQDRSRGLSDMEHAPAMAAHLSH